MVMKIDLPRNLHGPEKDQIMSPRVHRDDVKSQILYFKTWADKSPAATQIPAQHKMRQRLLKQSFYPRVCKGTFSLLS